MLRLNSWFSFSIEQFCYLFGMMMLFTRCKASRNDEKVRPQELGWGTAFEHLNNLLLTVHCKPHTTHTAWLNGAPAFKAGACLLAVVGTDLSPRAHTNHAPVSVTGEARLNMAA